MGARVSQEIVDSGSSGLATTHVLWSDDEEVRMTSRSRQMQGHTQIVSQEREEPNGVRSWGVTRESSGHWRRFRPLRSLRNIRRRPHSVGLEDNTTTRGEERGDDQRPRNVLINDTEANVHHFRTPRTVLAPNFSDEDCAGGTSG